MDDRYSNSPDASTRSGFDFNKPTIVAVLYLVGSLLTAGVLTLVGLVLAYVWKNEHEAAWMRSHFSYHIRTFWYSAVLVVIGVLTSIVGVGILILLVVGLYALVRTVLALLEAQKARPVPNPEALLW